MMKDKKELRKFGMVMAGALGAVSALLFIRGSSAAVYTAAFAGFFLAAGLALPLILSPVEWIWMKFAHILGFIMTNILLTVVFFTGVTLTGLVMRLLGKRPLSLNIKSDAETYWIDVDTEGPCGRPGKPY
jgi:hypothetical protein